MEAEEKEKFANARSNSRFFNWGFLVLPPELHGAILPKNGVVRIRR